MISPQKQSYTHDIEIGGRRIGRIALLLSFCLLVAIHLESFPALIETLFVIFACSVTTVYFLTPTVMALAHRLGAVDIPGGRHIHSVPTPRLGGIVVYAGVVIALLLTSIKYMPNLKALIMSSTLVLIIGVLDDLRSIRASVKLLAQIAACIILIADGIYVSFLPPTWWGVVGEWLITIAWIVGITNAINFLDGMDGLVAGLTLGTSAIYFILAMLLGSNMLAYCSIALFGAALSFLSYNIKPSAIFLGDGGSNFIGFFLAAFSMHGTWSKSDPIVSLFIPILILSVPIYDMIFTTVSRIATHKVTSIKSWLEFTGRDHIHHRMEALGLSRG
ncbi:MAG: undecaprenyl/decaprenyl-phosphate alpha-N-acetylglucosaminyl 1-phosphate transferase, partial [Lentisphaerae bacterium]|nr:undecaprenyl/decaprenyl-phosphate alpha-N-acetylglucosaminyl 1-phosphate transferase [Lentisphaerota bacterium]